MQGVSQASPANIGEADKIARTKQEVYKSEQPNDKDIVLYPEGRFYKAYERSAWRLCMLVHEFKVSCHWVGTAWAYIVSVGFSLESLD